MMNGFWFNNYGIFIRFFEANGRPAAAEKEGQMS